MNKDKIEQILNKLVSTGADFGEVFIENTIHEDFTYVDNRLDNYTINNINGMGLRIALDKDVFYSAINDVNDEKINNAIDELKKNISEDKKFEHIKLDALKKYGKKLDTKYDDKKIKEYLKKVNDLVRSKDKRVNQVEVKVAGTRQDVTIANHTGKYVQEQRVRSRLYITASFKDENKSANITYSYGKAKSYDFLDDVDLEKEVDLLIKNGLDKLYAKDAIGGVMPVVIGNGFGGVIFHEACGHAMEATSVADNISVLSGKLGEEIASHVVTIIDDGRISQEWGTTLIDDEGKETKKNILIENGVLKNYLIDEINNRTLKMEVTGSGRRESYLYPPTSRMNNTYLAAGHDTIQNMIKSIKHGLYAAKMGGGCVSPETGDFNFACDIAYMIRDGMIAECVKSASLIGNTKEILKEVEMVSDNLELGPGMCGSVSGYVPVNVGMPTIKVKAILVGGKNEE